MIYERIHNLPEDRINMGDGALFKHPFRQRSFFYLILNVDMSLGLHDNNGNPVRFMDNDVHLAETLCMSVVDLYDIVNEVLELGEGGILPINGQGNLMLNHLEYPRRAARELFYNFYKALEGDLPKKTHPEVAVVVGEDMLSFAYDGIELIIQGKPKYSIR